LAFLSKSEEKVLEAAIEKFGGIDIEEVREFIKRVVEDLGLGYILLINYVKSLVLRKN